MMQDKQDGDVLTRRHGPVAQILFNIGGVNAVRPQSMADLCAALDAVRDDAGVRSVVIGHTGRHFVAGADFAFLRSLQQATAQQIRDDIYRHFQAAARALYAYPKPTVACIGGAAITVGCELAIACDFRVLGPRAFFEESWIRLGLIPPLGGLKALAAHIGHGRAADMVLRGRRVGAAEAERIGLAHRVVQDEAQLEQEAIALAQELAQLPPLALQAAKAGLRRGAECALEDTLAASVAQQALLILSEDFREGVAAAAGQRQPVFKGV
ncbi:MAG TPA: enoyl-CoA hydratase/isomerase family protein [Pseudorhodoferax sp.]|nr:enoyl-CoA hydratase/isomerase family protein [Pseudorhodoferax sp.]